MAEPERAPDSSSDIRRYVGGGASTAVSTAVEEEKERGRRKREGARGGDREKEIEGDGGREWDPLVLFGQDIMTMIMKCLDARSVGRTLAVSRGWNNIASRDVLWDPMRMRQGLGTVHYERRGGVIQRGEDTSYDVAAERTAAPFPLCEELWKGKAHIPRFTNVRGVSRLAAFSFCIMDSQRIRIMQADLCDHVWEYRFKKTAPAYWRNLDPSWQGTGPPMRRYFHPNGSHTADPTDEVWGGHECTYSIVTGYVSGRIRNHYVRMNRWPQMIISRKPDWSWEMSNNLYCYNSIPDSDKEEGTGPLFPVW